MSSEYGNPIDPWSRFASYCSLVVALGTLAWVYFGPGGDRLPATGRNSERSILGHVDQLFEQESAARTQHDEELREAWRKQQQEQLTAYKIAADGMLAEHRTLINQLASEVQPATSFNSETDLAAGSPSDPKKLPLSPATEEPADEAGEANQIETADVKNDELLTGAESDASQDNDRSLDSDGLGFTPLLAYVREARKPDSNPTSGVVTVRNRGRGDAIVSKVEFTPSFADDSVFEVDSSVALVDDDERKIRPIVFAPQDNQAIQKGKHGVYARDLVDGLTVPAGQDIHVRLAVSNPKHLGWGFRGTLKINYNGFEPLVIEDAQLVFVSSDETIR